MIQQQNNSAIFYPQFQQNTDINLFFNQKQNQQQSQPLQNNILQQLAKGTSYNQPQYDSSANSTNCDSESDENNSSFNSSPQKMNQIFLNSENNSVDSSSIAPFSNKKKQQQQNYKTEMCRNWKETGECQYRKKCKYAHGDSELQSKKNVPQYYQTRDCKLFYQEGACPYGTRCLFVHVHKNKMEEIAQNYQAGFEAKLNHGIIEEKSQSRFNFAQPQKEEVQQSQTYEEFLQQSNPLQYQQYKMQKQQQQYQNYFNQQQQQYQYQQSNVLGMLQSVC